MNKLKYLSLIILSFLLCFILTGCTNNNEKNIQNQNNSNLSNNENSTYNSQKTAVNTQINNIIKSSETSEKEISSFSTPIQIDDDNRDTNMEITAKKIDGTIVKKGKEFSFNEVVGSPTEEKGYEKAGVFVNGKKVKGLGGGNCQVSTTIYDAVKKVDGLKVTERHEHGKEVGYVKKGDDATVAYSGLDLKFRNDTKSDIKLSVTVSKDKVTVKVYKLE